VIFRKEGRRDSIAVVGEGEKKKEVRKREKRRLDAAVGEAY
jgi:hypothetical protein